MRPHHNKLTIFYKNSDFYTEKQQVLEENDDKRLYNQKEEKQMELKDTINMMQSEDYKERFKAEYYQTKIRYDKLHDIIVKYEAGTLNFEPTCSLDIFKKQITNMANYLYVLEVRAEIEGIIL